MESFHKVRIVLIIYSVCCHLSEYAKIANVCIRPPSGVVNDCCSIKGNRGIESQRRACWRWPLRRARAVKERVVAIKNELRDVQVLL